MHAVRGKVCSICGDRVFSAYADSDPEGLRRCPICRRLKRPFDRSVAYGSYESGLRELIHLLKYDGVRPAATVLGRMLAEALFRLEPAFERLTFEQAPILVIPVPLYKAKQRQRGFNQAQLIARAAMNVQSTSARLQLAPDLLQRTRDTASQIDLSNHQRRVNLRGAFAVHRPTEVTGREVILVDDVYTTGATATECAQVLRRAGASKVWVATVARTQKLASNYEQFRPDEEENAASTLADDREVEPKVTVAHAAVVENRFGNSRVQTFRYSDLSFETRNLKLFL